MCLAGGSIIIYIIKWTIMVRDDKNRFIDTMSRAPEPDKVFKDLR